MNIQNEIQAALESEDRKKLLNIYNQCPAVINAEYAAKFLEAGNPYYDMCSVHTLATSYFHSRNYEYALLFSQVSFNRSLKLIQMGYLPKHNDLIQYLGEAAGYQSGCYLNTGENKKGIEYYDHITEKFSNYISNQFFGGFRLNSVEVFLNDSQFEKAFELMNGITAEFNSKQKSTDVFKPEWQVGYDRLKTRIDKLQTESTEITVKKESTNDSSLAAVLKQILTSPLLPVDGKKELEEIADNIDKIPADNVAEINHYTNRLASIMEKMSGKSFDENSIEKIRSEMRSLGAMLQHPVNGHDESELKKGIDKATDLLQRLGDRDEETMLTLMWIKIICLRRIKEPANALATSKKLREKLESKRNAIKNVNKRAGVFKAFPMFYNTMSEMAFESGQFRELLFAVEAAKGRNIIDKIASEKNLENIYLNFELPVNKIVELLAKNKSHYLSYFVDEDWSYAVLLCNNGKILAQKIEKGENQLKTNEDMTNPQQWQSSGIALFGNKNDMTKMLVPFIEILQVAEQAGEIKAGEHICYCPDGSLHLFPLHYILYGSQYLIEKFTVSKIHNAYQLLDLLEQPVKKAKSFTVVVTEASNDKEEKKSQFRFLPGWLKENLPGQINYSSADGDIEKIEENFQANDVLHFNTHGVFPKGSGASPGSDNPYKNSGLLMRSRQKLPEFHSENNYTDSEFLLSPYYISEKIEFIKSGNHISLQACVSGRSKEGYGGDALGMDWALFYKGMSSILSANWNIDIDFGNLFFREFYFEWLINKCSKAAAHQKATLKILKSDLPAEFPAPYYWAGFSLSGDWR